MQPQPQACLFDLDGLLLDTEPLHSEAWQRASLHFGKTLTNKQLLFLRGRRRLDCITKICEWAGGHIHPQEFLEVHQPISRELLLKAKAMPGAEDLINFCSNNQIPIALVTSSSTKSFLFKSAPHPWLKKINTRVLGDDKDLLRGKPAPDPFLLAAKRLKVNAKNCWALEDSDSGIKSALEAGCKVWVLTNEDSKLRENSLQLYQNPFYIDHLNFVLTKLKNIQDKK